MRVALILAGLAIILGAEVLAIRRLRSRSRADDAYAPSDGTVLAIIAGWVAFVSTFALLIPWPLSAGILIPMMSVTWGLLFWYFKGHRPRALKRVRK